MAQGRASRRLAVLAAPLAPEREPFYVRLPVAPGLETTYQAAGWYWVPRQHHTAVYLGGGFETAALALYRLNAEQERTAA
jgi:hypothetical protein